MARTVIARGQKYTAYHDDADPAGRNVMEITGHDQNYLDDSGQWQPVVEEFEADTTDGFVASALKMRHGVKLGGTGGRRWLPRRDHPNEYITFARPQYYNANKRWANIPFSGYAREGNTFTLTGNGYSLQISINWNRLKTVIVLENGNIPTRFRFPVELVGITHADGKFYGADGAEIGLVTPTTATDANGTELPVAESFDGTYFDFAVNTEGAAYPVTIDPDFAGSTADGFVRGGDPNYTTTRSTATYSTASLEYLTIGQNYATFYYCYRAYLKFDTSSIGDGTVTQVNLKLTATGDTSETDFDVQIVKQDWSGQDPLTSANREAAYDNCLSGTADASVWRNTSGMSKNTVYTSGNLSTAWINTSGYTYYSLRSSRDYGNNAPSGYEQINLAATEGVVAAYRPKLVIVYEEGGTPDPISITLDTATLTASGIAADVQPGAVSRTLDTAQLTANGITASVSNVIPPVSVTLATAQLTASGQAADVQPGVRTVTLDTAALTASGIALDVQPGARSITLDTASLTASPQAVDVQPGARTVLLDTASLTASGVSAEVQPGDVSIQLDTANLTAGGIKSSVSAGTIPPITISLSTATLTASPVAIDAQPGAVTIALATAGLTATGISANLQPGAVSVSLDSASLTAAGQAATVTAEGIADTIIQLGTATLTANAQVMDPQPGAVTVSLDTAQVTASANTADIQPGAVVIALDTAIVTAGGIGLDVQPGAVSIGLDTAVMTAAGVAVHVGIITTETITASHTYTIPAEARAYAVSPESREYTIDAETRSVRV